MSPPDLRVDGPDDARWTLVLAHGAGAPMDSAFLQTVAAGLATRGHRVVRFEFPYMAQRRVDGRKRGPNAVGVLEATFLAAVEAARPPARLAVGGKSMGGRVATRIAAACDADAAVVLGYPFHPPGRPERTRTAHLADLAVPTLIVQGERDPFGTPDEVAGYALSSAITLRWMADGNHDLAPRKASGHTAEAHLAAH